MQVTIFFVAFHVAKIPQNTYSLHEISRGIHTCHQPHGNIDPPGSRTWGQYLSRGLQVWRIGKSHENPRIGKGFFQYLSIQIWNDINLHWYIYILTYVYISIYTATWTYIYWFILSLCKVCGSGVSLAVGQRWGLVTIYTDLDVSENSATPKSSILRGFPSRNHAFWGTSIFGNTHLVPWCGVHFGVILSKTDDFNRDNSGLRTLGQHPHPCRHEQALLVEHWSSDWWTFTVYSAGTEPRNCSNFICPSSLNVSISEWQHGFQEIG